MIKMEKSRCWIEISEKALQHNLSALIDHLGGRSGIIAIVKADCYGHGCEPIIRKMLDMGIEDFAVATMQEAVFLRSITRNASVLILGYVEEQQWHLACENDCILTITEPEHALRMQRYAESRGIILKGEVKVDTGMNRIGSPYDCTDEQIKALYGNRNLKINGTFSHLCVADSFDQKDIEFTMLQKKRFDEFLAHVSELGYDCGRTHLCASSGIMNYPQFQYDYVRPGFIYFGFDVGVVSQPFKRQAVLKWLSRVEMVKTLKAGEGISYGQSYHCDRDTRIATVSVGYGDGYPRRLSNKGFVLIRGKRAPIVGRICMDQLMVDVSDIEDVRCEDIVTLIGEDGQESISVNEIAQLADTIVDEIVCDINPRVTRIFE